MFGFCMGKVKLVSHLFLHEDWKVDKSHDPHLRRFTSYLSLFTSFLLVLVTAEFYGQIFVDWKGFGFIY